MSPGAKELVGAPGPESRDDPGPTAVPPHAIRSAHAAASAMNAPDAPRRIRRQPMAASP
jgi:hypothetical protein